MKHYTHNYQSLYDAGQHGDNYVCEYYTRLFEREAAEYLQSLTAHDVGAVVIYRDAEGHERAYFDYENLVGSVQALGGTASDEV